MVRYIFAKAKILTTNGLTKRTRFTKLLLILIMIFQQALPRAGEYSFCKKIILTISTAGLYPIVKFFTKSDKQIIAETERCIDQAKLGYDTQILILEQDLKIDELKEIEKKQILKEINEAVLFNIARSIKYENIQDYLKNLKLLLSDLRTKQSTLQKRINKLRRINHLDDLITIKNMQELVSDIEYMLCSLNFLNNYVIFHKNFFVLNDLMRRLYNTYKKEIKIIFNPNQNYSLEATLRKTVFNKYPEYLYPYLVYSDTIKFDIMELSRLSHQKIYLEIAKKSSDLINKLRTIKNHIIGDPQYLIEKTELENKRLQQEIICLMKENIEIKEKNEYCKCCQKTCTH